VPVYSLGPSTVRYYMKQISNGAVLVLGSGGVRVNMYASWARDRGIDPRTFLLSFALSRPQKIVFLSIFSRRTSILYHHSA